MDTIEETALMANMFKNYPEILGTKDICKMLNINEKRVYDLVKSGELPRIPCSRTIIVPKAFVIKYVLQCAQEMDG